MASLISLLTSAAFPIHPSDASGFTPRDGICETSAFPGTGTPADPYEISTADQLAEVGDCGSVTGTNYSTPYTGNPLTAIPYFVIVNNIDLGGVNWVPLIRPGATVAARETKVWLNGQGHSITGLKVSSSSGSIGLFADLVGSDISNLQLEGEIEGTGALNVGTLAGEARESTFSNLVIKTSVSADATAKRVGGLVGLANANFIDKVRLGRLSLGSKIFAAGSDTVNGGVGGLVGTDDINYVRPWAISNSIVEIDVETSGQIAVGGLAGYVQSEEGFQIQNSHYLGSVSGTHRSGGLVGRLFSNSSTYPVLIASSSARATMLGSGEIGGLVGEAYGFNSTQMLFIEDSYVTGELEINQDVATKVGGLVGTNRASQGGSSITGSLFEGTISGIANSGNVTAGGLIGSADYYDIRQSAALGSIETTGGTNAYVGGIAGNMFYRAGASTFSESYAAVSFSSNLISSNAAAGVVGLSTLLQNSTYSGNYFNSTISGTPKPSLANYNPPLAISISTSLDSDFSGWDIDSYSLRANTPKPWVMCQSPVPSGVVSPDSCELSPQFAVLGMNGLTLTIYFNRELTQLPDPIAFSVDGTNRGASLSTLSSRVLAITLSSAIPGGEAISLAYAKPGSSPLTGTGTFQPEASSLASFPIINGSALTGPVVANLSHSSLTPTSIDVTFTCGGSCDSAASYDYVASITPAGGAAITQTGTTTGTSSLTFNNLAPNVAHVVSVTVTQGGLTSPAATLNITTPKPAATISAISVLDTSATLTVGCTNCGSAPDSFTASATPVAGGAAITSNTNVISGLSPETTYSFSVVVAFAGTTSDIVLWQDNPVMTLPLVPVITAVSPAAVPLTGGTITFTGSNFTTSSLLTLDGASLAFTIVSGTEITFTAPSDTAGSYDLAITNPVGTFTLSSAITYVSGPTLTTNSPVLATTNGGTIVTLTGTDLSTTTQVNVGSTTVSFSVVSNTVVKFTTAATSAGIVDIGVVTVGGADTLSNAIEFTTSALVPVVTSITPTSGSNAGGTTITVNGQYFSGSYSESVSAAINGISGSSVILIDDSTLTFVSPPGAAASGLDVSVATGGGVGTLAGAFTYTAPTTPTAGGSGGSAIVLNTPEILLFSTREIAASGGEVTATGRRLADISVLTLGGISVTIVSNTDTSVTFTTGEMPVGVWDLRLVGSSGTLTFQQAITVTEQAIVSESTGELLGWTWTLKFTGNSRSFSEAQQSNLRPRLTRFEDAETIICWGYTTAANPNAWAIAHATKRAQAACDFALANQGNVKTVVRLRYGVPKDYAMRSALQFWK